MSVVSGDRRARQPLQLDHPRQQYRHVVSAAMLEAGWTDASVRWQDTGGGWFPYPHVLCAETWSSLSWPGWYRDVERAMQVADAARVGITSAVHHAGRRFIPPDQDFGPGDVEVVLA